MGPVSEQQSTQADLKKEQSVSPGLDLVLFLCSAQSTVTPKQMLTGAKAT